MKHNFEIVWQSPAVRVFKTLQAAAHQAEHGRLKSGKTKTSKQEGLFKQVLKCIDLLESNPRHPSLHTHEFTSIEHPYQEGEKVFEAYEQHKTPGAYRVFWCYGPGKNQITIIAITPHP